MGGWELHEVTEAVCLTRVLIEGCKNPLSSPQGSCIACYEASLTNIPNYHMEPVKEWVDVSLSVGPQCYVYKVGSSNNLVLI